MGEDGIILHDLASPGSPDLVVTAASASNTTDAGQVTRVDFIVGNLGAHQATDVVLTTTIPSGVTWHSTSLSQGRCSLSGSSLTCPLGTLARGANNTVSIALLPAAAGSFSTTVDVTSTEADVNTADNSATTSTTVNAVAVVTTGPGSRDTGRGHLSWVLLLMLALGTLYRSGHPNRFEPRHRA